MFVIVLAIRALGRKIVTVADNLIDWHGAGVVSFDSFLPFSEKIRNLFTLNGFAGLFQLETVVGQFIEPNTLGPGAVPRPVKKMTLVLTPV